MKIEYGKWWNGFIRLIFNEKKIHHDEWIAEMELPKPVGEERKYPSSFEEIEQYGQDFDSIRIPLREYYQRVEESLIPLARHKKFSDVVDGDWKDEDESTTDT